MATTESLLILIAGARHMAQPTGVCPVLQMISFSHFLLAGDTIGCGVDFSQNRAFYTKNGVFLGKSSSISNQKEPEPEFI